MEESEHASRPGIGVRIGYAHEGGYIDAIIAMSSVDSWSRRNDKEGVHSEKNIWVLPFVEQIEM